MNIEEWLAQYGHWIIAAWPVLAAIAAHTPTEYDNKALKVKRSIHDALSFNWGNSKNLESKK